MTLKEFIKKLIILDCFWGRRSKIYHGVRDGGAKAISIGNPSIAKVHNGNTIFNVNYPGNDIFGGHYHDSDNVTTSTCINFSISDWVNNKIIVISEGTPIVPGQIGPHNFKSAKCLEIEIGWDIGSQIKKVYLDILIDKTTKNITLCKSGAIANFTGNVIINSIG